MARTLLLCFIHGFKGSGDTFHDFPTDLQHQLTRQLPDAKIESIVYPKYDTTGELEQATAAFLEWLKERVMDLRKKECDAPWPPDDNQVGVILVAHSMGGFVAADTLFLALQEKEHASSPSGFLFPFIQGILTFDTPYNGLSRSLFVYGGFSNYQKVSAVFNAMTALSAAAPALGASRTTALPATAPSPRWKGWQLLAVRTGTVGAIAAGGVAAYMNREAIMKGLKTASTSLNKESLSKGYQDTKVSLGQGLAYVNRGAVEQSFAWLSDHFTFVGALLKQKQLSRRLDHMSAVRGVGMRDLYVSLDRNGYWSGGYFVPERTFCAVPEEGHPAYGLFSRRVMAEADDEIRAHVSMFRKDKHEGYEDMVEESAALVKGWFLSEEAVVDDVSFQKESEEEAMESETVQKALVGDPLHENMDHQAKGATTSDEESAAEIDNVLETSPVDVAAAASLATDDIEMSDPEKATYVQYLMRIARQTGTGVRSWLPSGVPEMPSMSSLPASISNMPATVQSSMPKLNVFSSSGEKQGVTHEENEMDTDTETLEEAAGGKQVES